MELLSIARYRCHGFHMKNLVNVSWITSLGRYSTHYIGKHFKANIRRGGESLKTHSSHIQSHAIVRCNSKVYLNADSLDDALKQRVDESADYAQHCCRRSHMLSSLTYCLSCKVFFTPNVGSWVGETDPKKSHKMVRREAIRKLAAFQCNLGIHFTIKGQMLFTHLRLSRHWFKILFGVNARKHSFMSMCACHRFEHKGGCRKGRLPNSHRRRSRQRIDVVS